MRGEHKRRVFILGAGFSKPAGFPLATELTDQVLQALEDLVGPEYEFFELVEHIRRLHGWINRSDNAIAPLNIEELYEYVTVYSERHRLEQHRMRVGRNAGETPWVHSNDLMTWLSYLDDHLLDVLRECEEQAELAAIQRFIASLRPGDVVITFNYDRLVERCLTQSGKPWSFGMDGRGDDVVLVLKLHGSVDCICLRRHQQMPNDIMPLFCKEDLNRKHWSEAGEPMGETEYDWQLCRIADQALADVIKGRSLLQFEHHWALAGLGPLKRPSLIPGLGVAWEEARKAISHASEISIVGFSFSGYDRLAQIEFARVMGGRQEQQEKPPRIRVIDPALRRTDGNLSRDGSALVKRIESVFRPVEQIAVFHERYNWD